MRHIPLILGLTILLGLSIVEIYDFLVVNEGIEFYSSQPVRIRYILGLGVAGGVCAIIIGRLSSDVQHRLKVMALGVFGLVTTGAFVFFTYYVVMNCPQIDDPVLTTWLVVIPVAWASISGLLWYEFSRILRRKKSSEPVERIPPNGARIENTDE